MKKEGTLEVKVGWGETCECWQFQNVVERGRFLQQLILLLQYGGQVRPPPPTKTWFGGAQANNYFYLHPARLLLLSQHLNTNTGTTASTTFNVNTSQGKNQILDITTSVYKICLL